MQQTLLLLAVLNRSRCKLLALMSYVYSSCVLQIKAEVSASCSDGSPGKDITGKMPVVMNSAAGRSVVMIGVAMIGVG